MARKPRDDKPKAGKAQPRRANPKSVKAASRAQAAASPASETQPADVTQPAAAADTPEQQASPLSTTPPPPAPPPAQTLSTDSKEIIGHINDIAAYAKGTWFVLLGALVFSGITLLGVRDVDFFAAASETKLPLVGISVPVTYFFAAGSALVAAVYVYFHLYLELYWAALGRAPAQLDNQPLSERISPWLIGEWALRRRDHLTHKRTKRRSETPLANSAAHRSLAWVGSLMSISLVWLFGLLVLFHFWWRSMPAHIDWMSVLLGLFFGFALFMGWRSWSAANRLLAGRSSAAPPITRGRHLRWRQTRSFVAFACLALALSAFSLVRTASDWLPSDGWDPWFSRANLLEAQIVPIPKDWLSRDEAEREFRADWAKREGLIYRDPFPEIVERNTEMEFRTAFAVAQLATRSDGTPGLRQLKGITSIVDEIVFRADWARNQGFAVEVPFPPIAARVPEDEFQLAWGPRRKTYLDTQAKPVLDDRNLRNANLSFSFLPGVLLRRAKLEGANLSAARLEGADLSQARLEGANLGGASLEGAKLNGARLEGANLRLARLEGAELVRARLDGADLSHAILDGAILSYARLFGKNGRKFKLNSAYLKATDLSQSALRDAELDFLNLAQLGHIGSTFGDSTVTLPADVPWPCHWGAQDEGPLNDVQFFGRWRGWIEKQKNTTLPMDLDQYPAIPPPEHCPIPEIEE